MKSFKIIINYLVAAAVVVIGFMALRSNYNTLFSEVERDIASGRTVLLNANVSPDTLAKKLIEGGYFDDEKDARLSADWIAGKIRSHGGIDNLGQLNSPDFKMPADTALNSGGRIFQSRVEADRQRMGMDSDWQQRGDDLPTSFGGSDETGRITVRISNSDKYPDMPLGGIAVRLKEYTYDSVGVEGAKTSSKRHELVEHVRGFAVTDSDGIARFNVPAGGSYSVLPIKEGSQFGREKGTTTEGHLKSSLTLSFKQSPHQLTPLPSMVYRQIKGDSLFVVRTPQQFNQSVDFAMAVYLGGWALVFIFFVWRDRRMKLSTDYSLVTIIMTLSGIGLLAAYSINSPLTDKPNGYVMTTALFYGLVAMVIVSSINFAKFYNGKSRAQLGFIPFDVVDSLVGRRIRKTKQLKKRTGLSISSGFTYLFVAIGLIALLALFGSAPEGSVARVNLGGIQPSEISKYLIIIFIAAFFAENAGLLQSFSEKLTSLTARRHIAIVAVIVIVMLSLMLVYLKVLSDMGPALVLLITFIMIYSMARRDFAQMLLGIVTFFLTIYVMSWLGVSTLISCGVWFAGWIAFGWLSGRRFYESAFILNLLFVVFMFGEHILKVLGATSEATRLINRTGMSGSGVWDNTIEGGDQVAQGLWGLATGGISGMGLGKGNPSLVPACHTDMVFTSLGEMLGLVGLVLVILCFVILVHRSLLIGKRAAQPFVMYLVMGVAIVTGVQFLIIVMGSLGMIPLTGISVPFLSYGRTSYIVTMAMFGIVISASRLKATESQTAYANTYNNALGAAALLFIVGGLVIIATLTRYQITDRERIMIRPAYITNTTGERVIEYNPRINMILDRLESGNIYDRNGLLLATSSRDTLLKEMPRLIKAGLTEKQILDEANKRRRRYYPFGDHTLFMLGDANSRTVYSYDPSDPIGYLAESRHFQQLRNLDIRDSIVEMSSNRYRENRFIPKRTQSFRRVHHDYTVLIDFLNHGTENNPLIAAHNAARSERDLQLTLDAALQMRLQNQLAEYIQSDPTLSELQHLRASVVVLNASNGDLLCSANYPLPSQDSIRMLNDSRRYGSNPAEAMPGHTPLTERDLAMTFPTPPGSTAKVMSAISGLMKNSDGAQRTYTVMADERIEGPKEPMGDVSMSDAIRLSSNNYFINLTNIEKTYPELERLYAEVGARVEPIHRMGGLTPYFFNRSEFVMSDSLHRLMTEIERDSYKVYDRVYMRHRNGELQRKNPRWNVSETGYAWGQGGLRATPLIMARVASIVANDGQLVPTRYILKVGHDKQLPAQSIPIIGTEQASALRGFMQLESDKHRSNGRHLPGSPDQPGRMGGKTGTPERARGNGLPGKANDAWYVCFVNSGKLNAPLAIAIRLERTTNYVTNRDYQSGLAVAAIADCVLPALEDLDIAN